MGTWFFTVKRTVSEGMEIIEVYQGDDIVGTPSLDGLKNYLRSLRDMAKSHGLDASFEYEGDISRNHRL